MKKVVPLVAGNGRGRDSFCAHLTSDTAAAEPRGWDLAERICSLERGILCWRASSATLARLPRTMPTAGAITAGQYKPVTWVHDQLLLLNGLKEAGKSLPSCRAALLQLPETQTWVVSSTWLFPITLKGQFLQLHFRKCLCHTDSCSRKSAS